MPAVMLIACNTCDYTKRGIQSVTVAIRADGSEEVCPHPVERTYAERATGLPWPQLVRQGRIRYRYGLVCLGCGELDYYGPDQLGKGPRRWTHIGNIVSSVTTRQARAHVCRGCGLNALHPLVWNETEREILLEFWNWLQGRPNGPVCPACHLGRLSSQMVAMS
jgi:hypothetical protein